MQITLWLIEERPLARKYSKLPPEKRDSTDKTWWIPRSIVEHTSKMGDQHIVTLPDWWIEKVDL